MHAFNNFKFYFLGAIGVHVLIAFLFSFSFSLPTGPTKTGFVFLGSFLSPQDVGLFVSQQPVEHSELAIKKIKLDSKNGSDFREVKKPALTDRILTQQKYQFKPVMAQSIEAPQPAGPTENELDAEFEMPPPVKLRIGRDD